MAKNKTKPRREPPAGGGARAEVEAEKEVARKLADEQCDALDATAALWAHQVRLRLADVFEEVARVHAFLGHPDRAPEATALRTALDVDALDRIYRALTVVLEDAGALLDPLAHHGVPNLARQIRRTAEALGLAK